MEFDTLWLVHWPYFKLILFKSISPGICRPHSACFGFSRSSGKMILDWIKGLYNFIFLLISINTWPVYQNQAYNGICLFRHWICIQVNAFIFRQFWKVIQTYSLPHTKAMKGYVDFQKKIHTSKSIYRIVGLRIRFHGLSNRSLELDNSFLRIVYRSLE